MSESDEPKVGYKNPPLHTRFKKGQSGNPKGRPKKARGLKTDLKDELFQKMKIRMNGEEVSGTKQQLMLRTLTVRAASGDIQATRILVGLVLQLFGPDDHDSGPKKLSHLDQQILDEVLGRAPYQNKAGQDLEENSVLEEKPPSDGLGDPDTSGDSEFPDEPEA